MPEIDYLSIIDAILHGRDVMPENLFAQLIEDCMHEKQTGDDDNSDDESGDDETSEDDDIDEDALEQECLEDIADQSENNYEEIKQHIEETVAGEPIFRAMTVVDFPAWLESIQKKGVAPYGGDPDAGVNISWSWDKDGAINYAHWKCEKEGKPKSIVMEAKVTDPSAIDVDSTLATNLYYMQGEEQGEREIRLYPDKEIFLEKVCTCKKCYDIKRNVKT